MISYKDKTFCTGGNPRCYAFTSCPMALTDEVKSDAVRWWERCENESARGAPISQFSEPEGLDCYELPPGENTRKEENEN